MAQRVVGSPNEGQWDDLPAGIGRLAGSPSEEAGAEDRGPIQGGSRFGTPPLRFETKE